MMDLMKKKGGHAQPSQESLGGASTESTLPNPLPILSGPSPNAAPVSQEPVHKAQVSEAE